MIEAKNALLITLHENNQIFNNSKDSAEMQKFVAFRTIQLYFDTTLNC